jgi:hypothetical protein
MRRVVRVLGTRIVVTAAVLAVTVPASVASAAGSSLRVTQIAAASVAMSPVDMAALSQCFDTHGELTVQACQPPTRRPQSFIQTNLRGMVEDCDRRGLKCLMFRSTADVTLCVTSNATHPVYFEYCAEPDFVLNDQIWVKQPQPQPNRFTFQNFESGLCLSSRSLVADCSAAGTIWKILSAG